MADENEEQQQEEQQEQQEGKDDKSEQLQKENQQQDDKGQDEDDLSDTEKLFIKQLMDPKTSEQTLQMIAAGLGLDLVPKGTDAGRNRKEPSLEEELVAELGDDYGFLGPKLGKVFQKRLAAIESKFETKLATEKATSQTNALKRAEKRFFDDNPEARKLRKSMVKLASDYPMPQGKDANQYVRDLYRMAGGADDDNSITSVNRRNRRIDQNRSSDADNSREGAPGSTIRKVKGRIKLRDAVLAASQGETLERED